VAPAQIGNIGTKGLNFMQDTDRSDLPIERDLSIFFMISSLIAVLMTAASIIGIFYPAIFYPTRELARGFAVNDIVNLTIGLPILLVSMFLARKGNLIGLLCWPGSILFILYNYTAYTIALPTNWGFLVSLTITVLSLYSLAAFVINLNGEALKERLQGFVLEKTSGAVLASLGALFLFRVLVVLVGALINGTAITSTDLAVNVSDFITSPALIIGGIALWRHNKLGYVVGLGLLFQTSMLFIGLIMFLILQPLLTEEPFSALDVIVVFIMGLVSFMPFAFFLLGVVKSQNTKHLSTVNG